MIKTRAPLRISFAGGGTDIEPYCSEYGGCVLSMAIKKYTFATYPDKGGEGVERTISKHFGVEGVKIVNDAPPMSGLGGSASCFVAGIKAVKPELRKRQIAELAFHLERDVMKIAGGKQDQYMSAFGGLSYLEFGKKVKITQLQIPSELEDLLFLVYMGIRKNSGTNIIKDQMKHVNLDAFYKQKELAKEMVYSLERNKLQLFGELLDQAWHSKLGFTSLIANDEIKEFYYNCIKWGAIGGKLTGAGGGGYMLLMADPNKKDQLRLNLWAKKISFERVLFEGKGVCVTKQ